MNFEKLRFFPLLEEDGVGGTGGTDPNTPPQEQPSGDPTSSEPPKTFTQEDLNRVGAREKRQGVASVLKSLGFEDEESAKAFVEKYRKEENDKKDELTIANESLQTEKKAKEEAEKRVNVLEKKLKALSMGVPESHIEDVVTLATSKVTEDKSFDEAMEDLKKLYPSMFSAEDSVSKGTGGGGTPPRKPLQGGSNGIGKRLAEQKKSAQVKDNPYYRQ